MMKNMPRFAEEPDLWNDPYFESMLKEAEYARMAGPEKEQYRKAMRRDWDYWNTIDYARKESRAEGHAEGLAEGRADGLAEGHAEGLAEGLAEGETKGRLEEQHRIARRMLAAGLSAELVAESTSLPLEQVLSLQEVSPDQVKTD